MVCRLGFETVGVDIVPILVEANCRFIRAVTHPATVRVTIRVTDIGPKIVETTHDILSVTISTPRASASCSG